MEFFDLLQIVIFPIVICLFIVLHFRSRKDNDTDYNHLAADLSAGGPGFVVPPGRRGPCGRVSGKIQVLVRGKPSCAACLCLCSELKVMYWWKMTAENGHSVLLPSSESEAVSRAAIASLRLWGEMLGDADKVTVMASGIQGTLKTRVEEQMGDCQNKFGVRIVIEEWEEVNEGGASRLLNQLIGGSGAGQDAEGWHNSNLRVADNTIYQLVDHTGSLKNHFFEL